MSRPLPRRNSTKLVALIILALFAAGVVVAGVGLAYSAWGERALLAGGDPVKLAKCLAQPALDCDPRPWAVHLGVAGALVVGGLAAGGWLVRRARRLRRR
jgi:hypothetical protein